MGVYSAAMPLRSRLLTLATLLLAAFLSGQMAAQDASPSPAGQDAQPTTRLQVQSQLVFVPTTVRTKKGDTIYGLSADRFVIEDNGVKQKVRLDDSGQIQPISLVVVFQCSRGTVAEMDKLKGLPIMVDELLGDAPAEVAVVKFGGGEDLVSGFVTTPERRESALNALAPCEDKDATVYDAVEYAGQILEAHHAKGRRAILLISETRDHDSEAKAEHVIEQLSRSNIVLESVSFSPFRDEQVDAIKVGGTPSVLNPIALIAAAVQALRTNAPKTLARLTGGEYINFATQKSFDKGLLTLGNHVNNYYVLSFRPTFPADAQGSNLAQPGLHNLRVFVPEYPDARLGHRSSYWAEGVSATN